MSQMIGLESGETELDGHMQKARLRVVVYSWRRYGSILLQQQGMDNSGERVKTINRNDRGIQRFRRRELANIYGRYRGSVW